MSFNIMFVFKISVRILMFTRISSSIFILVFIFIYFWTCCSYIILINCVSRVYGVVSLFVFYSTLSFFNTFDWAQVQAQGRPNLGPFPLLPAQLHSLTHSFTRSSCQAQQPASPAAEHAQA